MTATQLAAILGVPISTLTRLERGERWANPDVHHKVLQWANGELDPLALTTPFIVRAL